MDPDRFDTINPSRKRKTGSGSDRQEKSGIDPTLEIHPDPNGSATLFNSTGVLLGPTESFGGHRDPCISTVGPAGTV